MGLRQAAAGVAKDDLLADADKIVGAADRFLELLTSGQFVAPAAPARVHAAAAAAPRAAAPPADAGVILVVDDNPSNRELLSSCSTSSCRCGTAPRCSRS